MSTFQPTNVAQALALRISSPQALSVEQKLFLEALQAVETEKRKEGKLPECFDNLVYAQTIEDVHYVLVQGRKSNKLWSEDVGKKWLKHMSKFAEYIWQYKIIIDAVSSRNSTLGAPIWGTIAFVIGVFKDLGPTDQQLKSIERTLERSKDRFKRYFDRGIKLSTDTQDSLITYYKVVINFAIEVHGEFAAGRIQSAIKLVHRTLKGKLEELAKRINHVIDDVDKGASIDGTDAVRDDIANLAGFIKSANAASTNAVKPANTSSTRQINFRLPPTSHSFTGRNQYLTTVWNRMHHAHARSQQARAAVHGQGGIGKTQILQKYANDQFSAIPYSTLYDIVIYVNASSADSVFSAISSFMDIYAPQNLLHRPVTKQDYTTFHAWLFEQERWLLVFDNVTDYNDVQRAIPEGNKGHILFSTRHVLVAKQVAPQSDPIEVLPLEESESFLLVSKLAESSSYPSDKSDTTARKVTDFAQGLPLLIEQIVHNALFANLTIENTLDSIQEKTKLLRQTNVSSLHEDNLSLGGIMMQAFETIESVCDRAEALFTILAYLEPSSIPLNLVRDGAKQYRTFLQAPHTYARGAMSFVSGRIAERYDTGEQVPKDQPVKKRDDYKRTSRLSFPWSTKRSKDMKAFPDLPVDDSNYRSFLLDECGPDTAIGRLFANQRMIDDAISVLRDAAVIRQSSNDTLWMHDRVSEVVKALIASRSATRSRNSTLTAAVLVYLTYPLPNSSTLHGRRQLLNERLPHAISAHRNLKDAGILNDCSIGPELSHLIASTIHATELILFSINDRGRPKAEAECRNRVISYYMHAYEGYMAGWRRLKKDHNVKDQRIYMSTFADREREKQLGYSVYNSFVGLERYGRSSPWRAMQTADKLALYFSNDPETHERAEHFSREVLQFYRAVFGENDGDTASVKQDLFNLFGPCQKDWRVAYDICMQNLTDFAGNRAKKLRQADKRNNKFLWSVLARNEDGAQYAWQAGQSCLELSKACELEDDWRGKIKWAFEAVVWLEVELRYMEWREGQDFYTLRAQMLKLASAYELADEIPISLYWSGRAVLCVMNKEVLSSGTVAAADETVLETMTAFEEARERMKSVPQRHGQVFFCGYGADCCKKSPHDENELREHLHHVEARITQWRAEYQPLMCKTLNEEAGVEDVDWDALLAQPLDVAEEVQEEDTVEVAVEDDGNSDERMVDKAASIQPRHTSIEHLSGAESDIVEAMATSSVLRESTTPSSTSTYKDVDTIDETIFPMLPPLRLLPVTSKEQHEVKSQEPRTQILEVAS